MKTILCTLNAKYIHTNLAIRYIKAYAAPQYNLELAEFTIKDPTLNIVTDLYRKQPTAIGFSCYIWNIEPTIEVIRMLKKINSNLTIFVGGPEVSYDVTHWLKRVPEIDYIVIGEGEASTKELLQTIENNGDPHNVHGLAFLHEGKPVVTPPREKLDLKTIPSPYRFEEDLPHLGKRITYIETSRGCPFNCQFCLSSIEVGVRYFDRETIKEDIRYLMNNGARVLKFVDRTFNISRSYAMDMFQFLIDEHLPGTVFQFEITADIMRPEVIEFLNEKAPDGLFRFEIGVQSTNDATNELVKRRQNFEKLTRTVSLVKEGNKIAQHLDLIAGLPEEDYDSFKKTFNDVFALHPEELQLGFLKMLRGTGVRIQANQYDYVFQDHAPYEILGNNVLSFQDIIKIKQVEDVLEKYWNDHRMDHTIEYLIHNVFPTPFDFFQDFGTYWDEQAWSRIGHQLDDLFKRLYQFLEHARIPNLDIVKGLMKIDYFLNHNHKPRKGWWEESLSKEERNRWNRHILHEPCTLGPDFMAQGFTEKDLQKHTLMETLPFDFTSYIERGEIIEENSIMLVYYHPIQLKPFFYGFKL